MDAVSFGTKFTPENLQKAVLGAMHPSVRAKVVSSSGLQYRSSFHIERINVLSYSQNFQSIIASTARKAP